MEIDRLRKELNELLDNVVDHSSRYSDNRPIPSLEISFVLKKINKMQETLTVLKYLLEQNEKTNKSLSKPRLVLPKMEDDDEDDDWDDDVEIEKVTEPIAEPKAEVKTSNTNSIEKMPIAKLVDAFSLNDRYLYANELFSKDMNAFNEAVKSLDSCGNLDEAKTFFSDAVAERQWDEENVHVISFFSLLERRFM